ncbi:MAG: hypothetical protein ABH878_10650, partial [bacterium]
MVYRYLLVAAVLVVVLGSSPLTSFQAEVPIANPAVLPEIHILEQEPNGLKVRIVFPNLEIQTTDAGVTLHLGNLPRVPDAQGRLTPVYSLILPAPREAVTVQVLELKSAKLATSSKPAIFQGDVRPPSIEEAGISDLNRSEAVVFNPHQPRQDSFNSNWVNLRSLGEFRELPVTVMEILPVRWQHNQQEVHYLQEINLQVTFSQSVQGKSLKTSIPPRTLHSLAGKLPLPALASYDPLLPRLNSNGNARLKIYISGKGVFHLSSAALSAWGVDLSSVDPRTIRLENRGAELPIFVAGEADGRFDEDDYIEFLGEALHSTYSNLNPEIYSDLYTDVNVYWLSWGGVLGARLVEESGEIIQADETKVYRAITFPFTVHSEQNKYYNRLSQVSPDSLKEHWYF